jgi:Restriction endonuclease XhoI
MDADIIEQRFMEAVDSFWQARLRNRAEQEQRGVIDQGNRAEVTGGTQLGALELLIADLLADAGLNKLDIRTRTKLEIPGYFRSEKKWDLLVVTKAGGTNRLVLAIELKSMAGSTGKNLNNRAEEIIGNAVDFWTAYRENRFGPTTPRPFLGFLVLVEDLREVNRSVRSAEPYFHVDPAFRRRTYAERWNILCQRLVSENLYTATCCEMITREPSHRFLDLQTSFQAFAAAIEGHAVTFRKTLEATPRGSDSIT